MNRISYFGNVCELDLIFNFHKAYYILDGERWWSIYIVVVII